MNRTQLQVDTYSQGYEARQRGEPDSNNPHPDTDERHHWWWSGWVNGNGGTSPAWYSRVIQGD